MLQRNWLIVLGGHRAPKCRMDHPGVDAPLPPPVCLETGEKPRWALSATSEPEANLEEIENSELGARGGRKPNFLLVMTAS